MSTRLFLSLCGFFFLNFLAAQEETDSLKFEQMNNDFAYGASYMYSNTDTAIHLLKKAAQSAKELEIYDYEVYSLTVISECQGILYNLKEMPPYFNQAEEVYQAQTAYFDTIDANKQVYLRLQQAKAYYHYRLADYDRAIQAYEKLTKEQVKLIPIDSAGLAVNYDYIGFLSFKKGAYQEALNYTNKALRTMPSTYDAYIQRQALFYNHLGQIHDALGNKKEAIAAYLMAEKKFTSKSRNGMIAMYTNMASHYQNSSYPDSVQFYFDKAIELHKKDDPTFIKTYQHYGESMLKLGKLDEALNYFNKALNLREKKYSKGHPLVAQTLSSLAETYEAKNDLAKAESYGDENYLIQAETYLERALGILVPNYVSKKSVPDLSESISDQELLRTLNIKAGNLRKRGFNILALDNYNACIELSDKIRKGYGSEASRQYLSEQTAPIYNAAIELSFDLQLYEDAFYLVEKSKAIGLMDALKDSGARKFANIPDDLIEQEQDLKLQIAYYENLKYKSAEIGDSSKIQIADNFLFDLKIELQKHIKKLEQDYPAYYQLKYAPSISSLKEIQASLNKETVLLEYYLSDTKIYRFSLTKNRQLEAESVDLPKDFDRTIKDYINNLSDIDLLRKDYEKSFSNYSAGAHIISDLLIHPSFTKTHPNCKQLIIIPHDVLHYLPFETLNYGHGKNYQDVNWLIKEYSLSYNYSAAHLVALKNKVKTTKTTANKFAGFAATYTGEFLANNERSGLAPLPAAIDEVEQILKVTGGEAWLKTESTEKRFKEEAPKYKILHLAMHGVLDDKNPLFSKLMFTPNTDSIEDNQLTALEIYSLPLEAELAVLSACKTGVGEIKKGEGAMSLSRAFSYAGCSSMVMSLWNVPDGETKSLMVNFYKNLKKGQTKDIALQNAKLDYLETADKYLSHPAYWGGFINSGDTKAMRFKNSSTSLGITLVFLALILVYFTLKNKKLF